MNLLDSLQNAIDVKVNISDNNKRVLLSIMKNNPDFFVRIQDTVIDIMKDGVIDIHDLPKLILLITQLFNTHIRIANFDMFGILEFVIFVIILELPFTDAQRENAVNVMHNSLMLLKSELVYVNNIVHSKCKC